MIPALIIHRNLYSRVTIDQGLGSMPVARILSIQLVSAENQEGQRLNSKAVATLAVCWFRQKTPHLNQQQPITCKKTNVRLSLLMCSVCLTYLCSGTACTISIFVTHKTICHQLYQYSGLENFQFMKEIHTCTYTFRGSVVELTDQCLMKATFLSVCSQTNVKREVIWHAVLGGICKAATCVNEHYSTRCYPRSELLLGCTQNVLGNCGLGKCCVM